MLNGYLSFNLRDASIGLIDRILQRQPLIVDDFLMVPVLKKLTELERHDQGSSAEMKVV
jgi:hypothetical protein